jgi:hypothetical protein
MLQPVDECFCGLDRGARFLENGIKSFWGIELGKKRGKLLFPSHFQISELQKQITKFESCTHHRSSFHLIRLVSYRN